MSKKLPKEVSGSSMITKYVSPAAIATVAPPLMSALENVAALMSAPIADEAMPAMQELVTKLGKVSESWATSIKAKVKALVLSKGSEIGEKGSKAYTVNGYALTLHAAGGGYDETKVKELLLGRKRKDGQPRTIESFCDVQISHAVNYDKVQQLIGKGVLTQNELDACRKERTYSVQQPTRILEKTDE